MALFHLSSECEEDATHTPTVDGESREQLSVTVTDTVLARRYASLHCSPIHPTLALSPAACVCGVCECVCVRRDRGNSTALGLGKSR